MVSPREVLSILDDPETISEEIEASPEAAAARRILQQLGPPPDVADLGELINFDAEELGITENQRVMIGLALSVERDDAKRGQIVQSVVPGVQVENVEVPTDDPFEVAPATILTFPNGQTVTINRPGFSAMDPGEVVVTLPQILLAITGAGVGGQVIGGLSGPAVGTALTSGAASIGEDIASGQLGSDREISLTKAAVTGGLAGLFEFGGPFVFSGLKRVFNTMTGRGAAGTVNLTPQGQRALQQLGIDPTDIGPETLGKMERIIREAVTPDDALKAIQAENLNIPLTRGQATGQPRQQAFESATRKGVFGEEARGVLQQFDETQRLAIQDARRGVQQRIGVGGLDPGDGIEIVQRKLAASRAALKAQVDTAFNAARDQGAQVLKDGVTTIGRTVRGIFDDEFGALGLNRVDGVVRQIEGLSAVKGGVPVKRLQNLRQQLSALTRSNDAVENVAARKMLGVFDESLGKAVDDALVVGDVGAVSSFAEARTLRKALADRFERSKLLQSLIEEADGSLRLSPTEALNKLIGAESIGQREGAAATIKQIKSILGEASPEFLALKEEAFLRLVRPLVRAEAEGFEQIGGKAFAKRLGKALEKAPETMKAIFSETDLKTIRELFTAIEKATVPAEGAVNFSNTTIVDRLLSETPFFRRTTRAAVDFLLRPTRSSTALSRATEAVSPPVPLRPSVPGAGAGAGVITAEELAPLLEVQQ